MLPWWALSVAFAVGWFGHMLVCHRRAVREFREHEANVKRRAAEIEARIANGCRQTTGRIRLR